MAATGETMEENESGNVISGSPIMIRGFRPIQGNGAAIGGLNELSLVRYAWVQPDKTRENGVHVARSHPWRRAVTLQPRRSLQNPSRELGPRIVQMDGSFVENSPQHPQGHGKRKGAEQWVAML